MAKGETQRGRRVVEVEAVSVWENLKFARQISQYPCCARADYAEPVCFDVFATRVKASCIDNWVDPFRDKDFGICEVTDV